MLTSTIDKWNPGDLITEACQPWNPDNPFIPTEKVFIKWPSRAYFEKITPNDGGSHRKWKSFEHYKLVPNSPTMCNSLTMHQRDFGIGATFTCMHTDPYYGIPHSSVLGTLGEFNLNLPDFYVPRSDGGFVPPPAQLDALIQRALSTMIPDIKAKLSSINSVIELKDFVSLPKSLKQLHLFFSKTGKGWKGVVGAYKTLKQIFKELVPLGSDSYLQLKFNIQPLISDIEGLYFSINRLERYMNNLISMEGRVQTRHFGAHLIESPDGEEEEVVHNCSTPTGNQWGGVAMNYLSHTYRRTLTSSASFHAQMRFNINFTAYQREHAHVLALMDSLGVNLNPAIIWNAIPWSFVVDWVFGVGRWLDRFKTLNMEPRINILDFLWSVNRRRQIFISTKVGDAYPSWPFPEPTKKLVTVVNESAYRRSVGLPSTSSIILSGLSPQEFSLGAALVLSRRRRH